MKTDFAKEIEAVKRRQAVALEQDKTSVNAAREFLRATYRLRNAIGDARSPLIFGSEFPADVNSAFTKRTADDYRHVYSNRLKPVFDVATNFQTATLECEVLFGTKVAELNEGMLSLVRELSVAVVAFIDDSQANGDHFRSDKDFGISMRSTVSGIRDEDDKYWKKALEATASIENFVREVVANHLPRPIT